jgi:hypothetical protein
MCSTINSLLQYTVKPRFTNLRVRNSRHTTSSDTPIRFGFCASIWRISGTSSPVICLTCCEEMGCQVPNVSCEVHFKPERMCTLVLVWSRPCRPLLSVPYSISVTLSVLEGVPCIPITGILCQCTPFILSSGCVSRLRDSVKLRSSKL